MFEELEREVSEKHVSVAEVHLEGLALEGHPVGSDDFALERVPRSARYAWLSVATQRFGAIAALGSFLLGATLGFGMTLWQAILALTLGCVILESVAILVGIAGQREGLSTSVLARWTGFGSSGSSLIGLVVAMSLVGWFGVQSEVFAQGLHSLVGTLPVWLWSVVGGLGVTVVVIYGFRWMAWTAYVTVPAFLLLTGWAIAKELARHSLSVLASSPAPGPHISVATGATLVAGGYIIGAVITPDMTRYNRSAGDVVKQTVLSITLGEYLVGIIAVLLAHAVKSANIVQIVTSSVGAVGVLVLITATIKINDWNLYSSSLGVVNFLDQTIGVRVNRAVVTLAMGILGTALAAAGILGHYVDFLITLGVAVPPIAGIMAAEYWIVRTHRAELDATRERGELPSAAPTWVPATLVVWVAAFVVGKYVAWGIPSLNSLLFAMLAYVLVARVGLIRPVGRRATTTPAVGAPASQPGGGVPSPA
jgi:cytosine permease